MTYHCDKFGCDCDFILTIESGNTKIYTCPICGRTITETVGEPE